MAADPADFPFLTFVSAVGQYFDSTLLFGRRKPVCLEKESLLLPARIGLVALPSYDSLLRPGQVARAVPGTIRAFWSGLSQVDVVWVFGPHPLGILLVVLALLRGVRVVLGVRQDTVAYYRARLPNPRWRAALVAVHFWNFAFRGLARILRMTVVGNEFARRYGGDNERLLSMTVSLVRDQDVIAKVTERDWSGTIDLLAVGRIDREKNPLVLVEAMAALDRQRPGRYRLFWAGTGSLVEAVTQRANELGIAERVHLLGFIPFGPKLLEQYRKAHVFVHVSLTEGVPAVLIEALASGIPVVATAVGGVAGALDGGGAGLLVPPSDVDALVSALIRIVDDSEHRRDLVGRGLELARECTLDSQAAAVARFIEGRQDGDVAT